LVARPSWRLLRNRLTGYLGNVHSQVGPANDLAFRVVSSLFAQSAFRVLSAVVLIPLSY
jgi:hypothetical protein